MPVPEMRKDEKEEAFIQRCMGDAVMNKEYPDQKQRAAICYSQAKKHKKETKGDGEYDKTERTESSAPSHIKMNASVKFDFQTKPKGDPS